MSKEIDLVVIGAGPAGIEAAITASENGVNVILIDSAPRPGGQYFQQLPDEFQLNDHENKLIKGQPLFNRLKLSSVQIYTNTLVWGIFEGRQPDRWLVTLDGPSAPRRLSVRKIILSTGAYDRSIPFDGWDSPGVITAGAAQRMLKNQRLLPGKRFVLVGTGPLQLQVAAYIVEAGGEVTAVCESSTALLWRSIQYLPALWRQLTRIKEGIDYLKTLYQARVPYHIGWTITSASGDNQVESVTLQKIKSNGKLSSKHETISEIDFVVVGFGLSPQTELCRLLGCELEYHQTQGGFVPIRNDSMQTTVPGIYAIGDGARIGGAENSRIEGQIAGIAVSADLGALAKHNAKRLIASKKPALLREQRFARMLESLFSLGPHMYSLAKEETVICRCEQVTLAEIRNAISAGAPSVNDIKNITRSGMGNCQGRTCASIISQILAKETGRSIVDGHYLNIRPPIHPIPLHVIEEYDPDLSSNDSGESGE